MKKIKQKSKRIIKERLRQILCQPWDRTYKFYSDKDEKNFRAGQLVSKKLVKDYKISERFLEEPGKEQEKIFKGNTEEFILARDIVFPKNPREVMMEKMELEQILKDVEKVTKRYLDGGFKEGLGKIALEAIKEMAEIALKGN